MKLARLMRGIMIAAALPSAANAVFAQSPEFSEPWKNPNAALAIDPFEGNDEVFAHTNLWYARFKRSVTDFPAGTWKTYTLWQFSSEMNCLPTDRTACLYTVPGTAYDMDVDVFNGTIEELKTKWPFDH